jgi:uncharacterized protein with GYD domain
MRKNKTVLILGAGVHACKANIEKFKKGIVAACTKTEEEALGVILKDAGVDYKASKQLLIAAQNAGVSMRELAAALGAFNVVSTMELPTPVATPVATPVMSDCIGSISRAMKCIKKRTTLNKLQTQQNRLRNKYVKRSKW